MGLYFKIKWPRKKIITKSKKVDKMNLNLMGRITIPVATLLGASWVFVEKSNHGFTILIAGTILFIINWCFEYTLEKYRLRFK